MLTLRQETVDDIPGIRKVVYAAFGRAGEADLVDALRASGSLVLSAVATIDDRIVGHVGYSPMVIGEQHEAVALAPVAVSPECQRQGIGAALVRWSLEECRRMGHRLVIVLGEPEYYGRFGFTPAATCGIECPFPAPSEAFMMLELAPGAARDVCGVVRYRPEFNAV